jgi:PAS domain S-box-containing protein
MQIAPSGAAYHSLTEAVPLIVFSAAADGTVDYYNGRWFEYAGTVAGNLPCWGWAPVLHPDDRLACTEAWTSALEHGTPFEHESRLRRARDGAYRWHAGRAEPVRGPSGEIVRWVGTIVDIEERKEAARTAARLAEASAKVERLQGALTVHERAEAALRTSEARLREVHEHAPVGLAVVALDGSLLSVNPALCRLSGYSREELLSGTFHIVTFKEDLDADRRLTRATLEGEIPGYTLEKRYLTRDRKVIVTSLSVSLVRDARGEPNYFIRQIQDIGQRKALPRGAPQQAWPLLHVDFDVRSQIRAVTTLLEPQFKAKGVSLLSNVSEQVGPSLNGDPSRLRWILTTLVANALKDTPAEGSVRIVVALEDTAAERVVLRFSIVDTGIGLPADVCRGLFRSAQAGREVAREPDEPRAGLALCKGLVEVLGGTIGVESILGSGTSFWVCIPFARSVTVSRVLDAPAREMGERRATRSARTERVLLAEDNEISRLLAIRHFKTLGFTVVDVAGGREAIAAALARPFDLIFLDCDMPVFDGLKTSKILRESANGAPKSVPIVGMIADATAYDREACVAAGMDDVISKPIDPAALKAIVARWLPRAPA